MSDDEDEFRDMGEDDRLVAYAQEGIDESNRRNGRA